MLCPKAEIFLSKLKTGGKKIEAVRPPARRRTTYHPNRKKRTDHGARTSTPPPATNITQQPRIQSQPLPKVHDRNAKISVLNERGNLRVFGAARDGPNLPTPFFSLERVWPSWRDLSASPRESISISSSSSPFSSDFSIN